MSGEALNAVEVVPKIKTLKSVMLHETNGDYLEELTPQEYLKKLKEFRVNLAP